MNMDFILVVLLYLRLIIYPTTIWAMWMFTTSVDDWRHDENTPRRILSMAFLFALFVATILKILGYTDFAMFWADLILTTVLLGIFVYTIMLVIKRDRELREKIQNGDSIILDVKELKNE